MRFMVAAMSSGVSILVSEHELAIFNGKSTL